MKGFVLNSNIDHVNKIIVGIIKKDGHCPCRLNKDDTTLCPCDDFTRNEICKCDLFIKKIV
ncbi:MAG: hypothetical protein ACRCW1_11835 [Anaerotignaceae bacterium]